MPGQPPTIFSGGWPEPHALPEPSLGPLKLSLTTAHRALTCVQALRRAAAGGDETDDSEQGSAQWDKDSEQGGSDSGSSEGTHVSSEDEGGKGGQQGRCSVKGGGGAGHGTSRREQGRGSGGAGLGAVGVGGAAVVPTPGGAQGSGQGMAGIPEYQPASAGPVGQEEEEEDEGQLDEDEDSWHPGGWNLAW